jgi:transposase-like protein
MARDGVAVDANLAAAVAAYVAAPRKHNVAALCRDLDVSRQTFYKYVRRFHALGVEGFYPDSRRPRSSPNRFPTELEDVAVPRWVVGFEVILGAYALASMAALEPVSPMASLGA